MKQRIFSFLVRFIPFTLLLFGLQYYITDSQFSQTTFYYSLAGIYLFHFTATLVVYLFVLFVFAKFSDYTGYAFMGAGVVKMLAAILFLLPMLLDRTENPMVNVLSFFLPYFLFLIFETIYAVKLINSK